MRHKVAKISISLAGLLVLGWMPDAFAVEEIGQPAGDLPEPESLPDVAPTEGQGEDTAAVDPAPDSSKKTPVADAGEDNLPQVWDSYSEAGTGGVAQEITKGVRVEDIVEPPSDYRYAAFGKADPFVPPMITTDKPTGPGNLEIPIVSPLQRFEVGTLQLVGVWQLASGERKAMVLTPGDATGGSSAGQGIIVKNGDPIGTRGGKILGIGDDFLTVREFMLALDGTRQYEDQQMYMGTRNPDENPGKIIFKPGEAKTEVQMGASTPVVPVGTDPTVKPMGDSQGLGPSGSQPNAGVQANQGGVGNTGKSPVPSQPNPAAPANGSALAQPAAPTAASAYTPLKPVAPTSDVSATPQPTPVKATLPPAKTF